MAWDTFPTAQQVPGLQAKKDPNLTIAETSSSNPYIVYNYESPNNNKAMSKLEFRQALSHATNRDNIIQVLGGKVLNTAAQRTSFRPRSGAPRTWRTCTPTTPTRRRA